MNTHYSTYFPLPPDTHPHAMHAYTHIRKKKKTHMDAEQPTDENTTEHMPFLDFFPLPQLKHTHTLARARAAYRSSFSVQATVYAHTH